MGIYLADIETNHPTGSKVPAVGDIILYPFGGVWYWMDDSGVPNILGGVTDHGNLTGLGDDDHTQYLNETRHDSLPQDNPHGVTKAQVGLGNADNTSDLDKPISTAQQSALDSKYDASNPNGYETPAQLDSRDTANRDRSNHTGTQTSSTISDFQSSVSSNSNVTANTAKVSASGSVTTHSDVGGPAPLSGQVLTWINANNQYEPRSPDSINPSSQMLLYDDFVSGNEDSDEIGALGWRSEFSGTGAESIRAQGLVGNPGIYRISTGTANNARSSITLSQDGRNPILIGAGGIIDYETLIIFRSANFSLNEGLRFGLGNSIDGTGFINVRGIFFEKLGADATLFFLCRNAGVQTRVDTGLTLTDGFKSKLGFQVNASGNSVQAIINGSPVGSPITTNIPALPIGPFYKCSGLNGGVNSQLDIDYFYLRQTFTTPR